MVTKQVFEIMQVVPEKGTCLVRGLAYDDLQIGDNVFIVDQQMAGDGTYVEFEVAGILTYQTEMQFLGGGLTGQLTLKGKNLAPLRDATHLLKLE